MAGRAVKILSKCCALLTHTDSKKRYSFLCVDGLGGGLGLGGSGRGSLSRGSLSRCSLSGSSLCGSSWGLDSGGRLGNLGFGRACSFSLFDNLGDEFLVLGGGIFRCLVAVEFVSLLKLLAAKTLFGDQALDLGCFVVSLVTAFDFATGNIFADVVLLGETENGANLGSSLLEKTGGNFSVRATRDFLITLLHDFEGNDAKVGTGDAATDRSSSSVALSVASSGVEERAS